MTAQIIPFPRPIQDVAIIDEAPFSFSALADPGDTLTIEAEVPPIDAYRADDRMITAGIALSAACREMATSLALLIAHCEAASAKK